jgi:hypothetical protein
MATPLDSSQNKAQTDWDKCCFCQNIKKDEELKAPIADSTQQDGYSMLASNLPTFQAMNQMPLIIDPSRLDEGQGIETTLRERGAKYHKSCRLLFNYTKLKRATKRASSSTETTETVIQSKIRRTSL